jgi:hypothetical protein
MTTKVTSPRVAGAGDAGGARLRVPWGTVLPLAVVAAFGSTFWIIAIRGAVGAVERSSSAPFPTWLRESTLMLPLYVFAVLGALTLAVRWFRNRQRTRTTIATFLLVVAAVSVVGAVVLVANAVYDYQLQSTHLIAMNATHGTCNPACVAQQQQDAVGLQVRAIAYGSGLVLVTNLVLLGLLVAFRGGKLDIASARRAPKRVGRFDNVELFLLAGLLGAAVVHATVVTEQLSRWPAAGIALLVLTVAEVDVALLFLLRLRSVQYVATAVVSAVPLLVWLYSRTAGLPFGPDAGVPPQIDLADAALAALEAATLVVAIAALRSRRSRQASTSSSSQHAARLALAGVVAISAVGLAGGLGLIAVSGPSSHASHTGHSGPPTRVVGSTLKSVNPGGL